MLIAANWDLSGAGRVFSRDDATGGWTAATLAQDPQRVVLPPIQRLLNVGCSTYPRGSNRSAAVRR
jgi:hypothetical protein